MVSKTEEAQSLKDARENLERPTDRPMTGILTKDDGKRTEHGLHPLDPSYNGTVVAPNKGVEEAATARVEAGLEETGGEKPAEDVEAKKSAQA
jgi:hypothetical protein